MYYSLPLSQYVPVIPTAQVQLKVNIVNPLHVLPFLHGPVEHGETSATIDKTT